MILLVHISRWRDLQRSVEKKSLWIFHPGQLELQNSLGWLTFKKSDFLLTYIEGLPKYSGRPLHSRYPQTTFHPFDLFVFPFLNLVQTEIYLENEIYEVNTAFHDITKMKFDWTIWMFEIKCYVTFRIWFNFFQIFFVIRLISHFTLWILIFSFF